MVKELKSTDWTFLCESDDMKSNNELFNKFCSILNECIGRNIPIQKITQKRLKPSRPWLHPNLCKCNNTCKQLYAAVIQKGASDTSWNTYVNYWNVLNHMKYGAMKIYFSNKWNEFKNNGKRLWQIIHNVTNCQKDRSSKVDCLEIENIKCFESKLIAEEFVGNFSNVGLIYSNKIPKPCKCINEYLKKIDASDKSIFLKPISEDEVSWLLASLKSKNSHGHDGISNKIIKEIWPALCKQCFSIILYAMAFSQNIIRKQMLYLYISLNVNKPKQIKGQYRYYQYYQKY